MIVWANLDQESRWSGLGVPAHVAERISYAGALLAALAPDGPVDLYTPTAIDPSRVHLGREITSHGTDSRQPIADSLCWAAPTAQRVNDRRFALALGYGIPGTRVIESPDQLDGDWPASWVAKAVWTAAGRDRARGEGAPTGELRARVKNLVARAGAVVVEPWLPRVLDLGVTSFVGKPPNPPHSLLVDERGGFLGIDLTEPELGPLRARLDEAVATADAALAAAGYSGPFTVDAFVYRDGDRSELHPLCELNARYTFGHIARALAARRLGFGPPPDGARVLVDPPFTAWVA
jgi:hypothetical protein